MNQAKRANLFRKLALQVMSVVLLAVLVVEAAEVALTLRHERQQFIAEARREARHLAESIEHTLIALVESGSMPTIRRVVQNHAMLPLIDEIVLMDPDGVVVAHGDRVVIDRPYDASHIPGLADAIFKAQQQDVSTEIDLSFETQRVWVQVTPMDSGVFGGQQASGVVVVVKNMVWLVEEIAALRRQAILVGSLTIVALMILLGFLQTRLVIAPLGTLMRGLGTSRQTGKFRLDDPLPSNEIGALGEALSAIFKQLEDARDEANRLANVAQRTDNAVIIADPRAQIEWVNEGFTRLTGYTPAEAVGRKPGDLLQGVDTDQAVVQRMRTAIAESRAFREEIVNYTKAGEPYWVLIDAQPVFDEAGDLQMYIALESDVTERRAYVQAQKEARQAAENAVASRSEFLANMSHEIRTPMTAILGFSELLERGGLAEEDRQDFVASIRSNGEHLLTIINDILDLSKIEAGRMSVETIDVSLHELVQEVKTLMQPRALEKGLVLKTVFAEGVPLGVQTDPVRLRQILLNLVGNAIKFTETGSVYVAVAAESLSEAEEDRCELQIRVVDTGIGLSEDQIESLFQPFTQADSSTTRRFGGTGLGLSISRRLARLLNGDLYVQSRLGEGSTFTVTLNVGTESSRSSASLPSDENVAPGIQGFAERVTDDRGFQSAPAREPVNAPDTPPSSSPRQPLVEQATKPLNGLSVLVVEDGEDNQRLIKLMLSEAGAEVTLAEHGQAALDRLQKTSATTTPFDLILMDMQMPVMDGYTATHRLREIGLTTPIIALTANAMAGDRQRCLKAGCNDYAAKPIQYERLIALCQSAVKPGPDARASVA